MLLLAGQIATAALTAALLLGQSPIPRHNKIPAPRVTHPVWDLSGGIPFETDGRAPSGACFRLRGWMTNAALFSSLRRYDTADGAVFKNGAQVVTEFPEDIDLNFSVFDFPCSVDEAKNGGQVYLTRETMRSMTLSLYWKRDLKLRPVASVKETQFAVAPRIPEEERVKNNLPERLVWNYVLTVKSAGVPLTDSLVLIIESPDKTIAARCAARL
jgi:hypothetical protein